MNGTSLLLCGYNVVIMYLQGQVDFPHRFVSLTLILVVLELRAVPFGLAEHEKPPLPCFLQQFTMSSFTVLYSFSYKKLLQESFLKNYSLFIFNIFICGIPWIWIWQLEAVTCRGSLSAPPLW